LYGTENPKSRVRNGARVYQKALKIGGDVEGQPTPVTIPLSTPILHPTQSHGTSTREIFKNFQS